MKNKGISTIIIVLGIIIVLILILASANFKNLGNITPTSTTTSILTITKPNINSFSFSCSRDIECVLVQTGCCNNNLPTQNTCLSKNDAEGWKNTMQNYCNKNPASCPNYAIQGNYSCFCDAGRCWTNAGSFNYTGIPQGV